MSLNFRDLMVIRGHYNPRLPLPVVPLSDAAGEIVEVGAEVTSSKPGDRVVTHFVVDWDRGPFRGEYLRTT
ncbi:MAG: alcohol dehydrogenase catalytic domain-containing protein, partial [Planctomycetes bacterium]|nr:alcohol dehydrogenase catalytic domain-containing protein [Planctomycetota bacterium]